MAHILGLPHTFGGVVEGLGNILGGFGTGGWIGAITALDNVTVGPGTSPDFITIPGLPWVWWQW